MYPQIEKVGFISSNKTVPTLLHLFYAIFVMLLNVEIFRKTFNDLKTQLKEIKNENLKNFKYF